MTYTMSEVDRHAQDTVTVVIAVGAGTTNLALGTVLKSNRKHIERRKGALDSQPQAYQLHAHGQWFSPASSTTKTGRRDIAEILLKVALKHQKSTNQSLYRIQWKYYH
jgi:hypothetical protein